MRNSLPRIVAALCVAAALAAAGCGGGSGGSGNTVSASSGAAAKTGVRILDTDVTRTVGPNGETPTPAGAITFTDGEIAQLKAKHATAAFAWAATSPFIEAVQRGASDELRRLGIAVGTSSQANFDAGKQVDQLQTAASAKPAILLTNPVDPTTAGKAYDKLTSLGTRLVFLSNTPVGYKAGVDYAGIVTDNLSDMGARAADSLAQAIGDKGDVAVIYYDVPFFVTNERDGAFATRLRSAHPNVHIAATAGFKDPSRVGDLAAGLLAKHPNLAGVYVSWSQPAIAVLSALRAAGNHDAKVVTLDLDDTIVSDMASGGQVAAVIVDKAYDLGRGMADAGAAALLGRQVPPFSIVGSVTVTKDTIAAGYQESLHQGPSAPVLKAMGQG